MAKKAVSCKYNQECWLKVRLPKIRAAAKSNSKIYLPYQCSFVQMGDLENCSVRDRFIREHNDFEVAGENVSTERVSTDDI